MDYKWLTQYKRKIAANKGKAAKEDADEMLPELIALHIEEGMTEPEGPQPEPGSWAVESLLLQSPGGDSIEIRGTSLSAIAELLTKITA